MNKQMSLSGLSDELAQVRTKKKEFLEQIERIVPWGRWIAMIKPCYYKGERGNKPYDLELMLRLYLLQNLYNLSDEATVAEAMDSRAFSEFCGVESSNQVPDGDTLGRFRNILVHNGLQEQLFAQVIKLLGEKGLLLKKGTIVDSTIIAAPSSTKNQDKQRDPDAHQVKKGNEWHFGYKAHIGVDKDSGLIHTLKVTAANVHDVTVTGWFHDFVRRTGLPEVTVHGLRHTFITLLISKGVDIVTVSNLVGHAMPSTTINMYAHAVNERKASAVEAIGIAFDNML